MNYKSAVSRLTILLMQNELRDAPDGDVRRDIPTPDEIYDRRKVDREMFEIQPRNRWTNRVEY